MNTHHWRIDKLQFPRAAARLLDLVRADHDHDEMAKQAALDKLRSMSGFPGAFKPGDKGSSPSAGKATPTPS
jgi:hypothetical protein